MPERDEASRRRQGRRRRDAAATRESLLHAAAEVFAERGFERTTVREVAARAGVNQALLFRYFGSKHDLFARVLTRQSGALLSGVAAEHLPARILDGMLATERSGAGEHPFVAMLRSLGDERAARVLRDELGESYSARLAELSDAPDARVRADLVLSWLFGLGMVRSVLGKSPLTEASPELLAEHMTRAIAVLLERTVPATGLDEP